MIKYSSSLLSYKWNNIRIFQLRLIKDLRFIFMYFVSLYVIKHLTLKVHDIISRVSAICTT